MSNGSVDWGALAAQWAASQRESVVEPEMPPVTALNGVPPPVIHGRHHYHPPPEKHFPSSLGYIPPPTSVTEQSSIPDAKLPTNPSYDIGGALFPSTVSSEIKNTKAPLPASITDYGVVEKPPGIDSDDGPPGLGPDSSVAESGTGSSALPPGEEAPPGMDIESATETGAMPVSQTTLSTDRTVPSTPKTSASAMPHYPPHQYPPQSFPQGPPRPPPGYPQYYPPPYQGGPPPHPSHGYGPPPPQHMTGYGPPPGHRGTPQQQFGGPPYRGGFNRGFFRAPGGPTGFRHYPPSDPGNSWLTPQNELPGTTKGGGLNGENEIEEEQKKKHVPLWIKQELERLEADKAKKAEKEKVRSEASSSRRSQDNDHASTENSQPSSSVSTRRYFDVPDERYGKYGDHEQRDHRRRSKSRSRSKSSGENDPVFEIRQKLEDAQRKRSPSPILTEEEREAKLLKRTKIILTEILLAVTNEEIESVAREVYDRAKRKERPKVREDFRIDYDRSDSESRGSPNKQSESEESDYDGRPMFRNERITMTDREYSRTESQYERNGNSNSRREPTPPSRQQPEFSRLSPSIRERFEPKEDDRSPIRQPERSRDGRDSKFKPEKERVPVTSPPPPPRERTPESQTGKEAHRTSSKSDRKRQRSSRSRSEERRTTAKKNERRGGHDSDYDDSNGTKQRFDRSRSPEKKISTKTKRRKSRTRSLSDREKSYVEETSTRSDRKRSGRKEIRDSRSRSRSRTRSPVVSKSEKKPKHKKSSYRDEDRSKSRDRLQDEDRYSDDYDRDSSTRKSKKKKKK